MRPGTNALSQCTGEPIISESTDEVNAASRAEAGDVKTAPPMSAPNANKAASTRPAYRRDFGQKRPNR